MEYISRKTVAFLLACITALSLSTGCSLFGRETAAVVYTPATEGNWETSTPEDEGISPDLVARLYSDAEKVRTITSLLVIKNGKLIAEKYYNGGSIDKFNRIQSVTKSITSALTGIAVEEGYLSLDRKMMEFFPELQDQITDPGKNEITVQQLLMMRAGYPWEESTSELFAMLYGGFRTSLLVDVPLVYEPGTDMKYSNLSSHILGIMVSRATGSDLMTFAEENLFGPMGIEPGEWTKDWEGNYNGHADLHLRARDMARFGLLYLDGGTYRGEQLVNEDWIYDSLKVYTEDAWDYRIGRNVSKMGYGYLWWSAEAGGYRYPFAWGHGGQLIALVPGLDMVIVVTADPLVGQHGGKSWKFEKQNLNLVGNFVSSLPLD